jgi:hypothetical protein
MEWQPPPNGGPAGERITLHDHIAQDLRAMYDADVPWFTKDAIRAIMRDIARIQHLRWPYWLGWIYVKGLGDNFDLRPYSPGFLLEGRLPNGDWVGLETEEDLADNVDPYLVQYAPYSGRSLIPFLL